MIIILVVLYIILFVVLIWSLFDEYIEVFVGGGGGFVIDVVMVDSGVVV